MSHQLPSSIGSLVWIGHFFFLNDTATTEIYPLSLHDALPISPGSWGRAQPSRRISPGRPDSYRTETRSEEHTSELQSRMYLGCRLLLEKKKGQIYHVAFLLLVTERVEHRHALCLR